MGSRPERRLAAIMVADVVGYSRMMEDDEAGTVSAIRTLRSEVMDPLLAEYKGRIIKLLGDGLIVEFGSIVDAVAAAAEMQRALEAKQANTPPGGRAVLRIGINLGDVLVDGDDLLGDGVIIAARLEQLCEPGGVLVSGSGFDQLQGKLDLPLEYVAERHVKNIKRPVKTYRVRLDDSQPSLKTQSRPLGRLIPAASAIVFIVALVGAGLWFFRSDELSPTAKPSIAVLPFDNLSRDEPTKRLADGITEDIITNLSRYRDVDVIARNSTAVYESKPTDVRQIGRDLNVRYILEGSIQRQEERIRITAQLVDANTGGHLWSERWDRPVVDLFAIQSEISDQVTNRLIAWRGVIETAENSRRRTQQHDMTAYDLYRRGGEAVAQYTKESIEEAVPLFELAVKKDPTLASAWRELGAAHQLTTDFGSDPRIALPKAMDALQRAIELDPMDGQAHAVFGLVLGLQGEMKRAEAEFDTALELNPGSADIMAIYAPWTMVFGEPQRGAELIDRVIRLNPLYPPGLAGPFSYAYIMAGRYEDALHVLERQSTDNYTLYSWINRSICYALLGRVEEAKSWVAKTLARYPSLTIEGFLGTPGFSDSERTVLSDAMRTAGFPPCAHPEDATSDAMLEFLPECQRK